MNTKIDGVFEYKSYRYIPYNLRNEWKTLYNIYSKNFYNNMHKRNKLFSQMRVDFYNEELSRLDMLDKMCNNFELKVINLKGKYENEKKYSEDIKKSIINSLKDIKNFIKINKNIVNEKFDINDIPLKNNIEYFDNSCHNLDRISDKKTIIVLSLFITILIFYLTFESE